MILNCIKDIQRGKRGLASVRSVSVRDEEGNYAALKRDVS